ncbi:MAG TPA: lysylphosphatidylglycerol synthase transmembrane domain-containing protein [Candidatus Limnocylindrales bacterium]|nr:lysylphosphatidylglycerol synthase transmembrane domain-containing protein [Candidatus Limnocylindrales bacterium]
MTTRGRRSVQLAVGLGLSALFLWLAVRGENWGQVGQEIARADYRFIALMFPAGAYGLYTRCQRWRILLERSAGRPLPMMPIYSASAIGFMANMVLPFRVGEIARPYLVARSLELSMASAVATVAIERVLDLVALAIFGVIIVSSVDVAPEVSWMAGLAAMLAIAGFGGAYVITIQRERLLPVLDRLWARIPRIGPMVVRLQHEFIDSMSTVSDFSTVLRTVAWSLYIWFFIGLTFALGFAATGIDVPYIGGGVTVATVVALAVAVPGAPGFVGQFEWGCKVGLGVFGVTEGAIGYAILVHASQFAITVILGVVCLAREGLSFRELSKMEEKVSKGA